MLFSSIYYKDYQKFVPNSKSTCPKVLKNDENKISRNFQKKML